MKEQLISIFLANGAILIIPGLNFAVLTRYAIQNGLATAIWCTLGITFAISLHVILSMMGSHKLINSSPALFSGIQIAGSLYIFYFSSSILMRVFKKTQEESLTLVSLSKPFFHGLMIDLLNPFVTIFYLILFSSVITKSTTFVDLVSYLIFIVLLTFSWFIFVAVFFSHKLIREKFLPYKKTIEIVSALILYYYSIQLFLAA